MLYYEQNGWRLKRYRARGGCTDDAYMYWDVPTVADFQAVFIHREFLHATTETGEDERVCVVYEGSPMTKNTRRRLAGISNRCS